MSAVEKYMAERKLGLGGAEPVDFREDRKCVVWQDLIRRAGTTLIYQMLSHMERL